MRVAVITGGSGAIGTALIGTFLDLNCRIVAGYSTQYIRWGGDKILDIQADISNYNQAENLINAALGRWGQIDVLINCAGIHRDSTVEKMDTDTWQSVIDVNLTGTFNCIKAALPHMKAQPFGRIVNVTSVTAQTGAFGAANYAASKAGICGLTRSVAREVARYGVTVNAVALGYFNAGMGERLPQSMKDRLIEQIPMRRFGSVEEAVAAVRFLASWEASYITGQVVHVNGGYYV